MSDAPIVKAEPKEHWVRQFVRRAAESVEKKVETSPAQPFVKGALTTAEVYIEGVAVGGLLGGTKGMFGANAASKAAGATAASMAVVSLLTASSHPGVAQRARTLGGQAAAVLTAWKSEELTGGRGPSEPPLHVKTVGSGPTKNGAAVHGEIDDPILRAAARPQR